MANLDDYTQSDPVLRRLPPLFTRELELSNDQVSTINAGSAMVAEGQSFDDVFLISEGWAVSKMLIKTGDTQIMDILGPGSFIGMSRLNDRTVGHYAAIALQDLRAYKVDRETLRSVCAENKILSCWLADLMALKTQRTQRHLTALGQLPARGRLAFIMLRILDVAQQMGQSATGKVIRLPMTQNEIGNMLGLTNVSISKMMSTFRDEGLIDYGRNRIAIHDVERLSEICGMEMEDIPMCPTY